MEKTILISETSKETRIAILENGDLVEFFVEKPENTRMVGDIYKGRVENVIEGMQAAFVDIGYRLNAFLPFSEINEPSSVVAIMDSITRNEEEDVEDEPDLKRHKGNRKNIKDVVLKTGQEILVQVIKEPFANKGPRVTTDISLPGRFLVLVPNADYIGISKKIYSKTERKRLRRIGHSLKPKNFGLIIRTISGGKDKKTLNADLKNLLKTWQMMEDTAKQQSAPVCLYSDMEMSSTVIRDLLSSDVNKITIDSKSLYKKIHAYVRNVSPEFVRRLEYYHSKNPLFYQYKVEKEFEKSLNKRVWLKNGGFIVIEHTEAMCTIDVNSGKFIGKANHEENSLKINLEAARSIARHLRLRDVGGLIVIDFIDMENAENKKLVFQELRRELSKDRSKLALSPISDFGLLEMTRQRTRVNLLYSVSEECPVCHGSGRITSKESLITKIESWIRRFKVKSKGRRLILKVHPDIASYIAKSEDNLLRRLQWQNLLQIRLQKDPLMQIDEFRFISARKGKDITDQY